MTWPDDVRRGDKIVPRADVKRTAREVLEVRGDRLLTSGMSGNQRDRWMSKANLRRYVLVSRTQP